MTNNIKTLQTAAWVTVGTTMIHCTGASVESRRINEAGDRAWIIVGPTGVPVASRASGKVAAYKTPDKAALVFEKFIAERGEA